MLAPSRSVARVVRLAASAPSMTPIRTIATPTTRQSPATTVTAGNTCAWKGGLAEKTGRRAGTLAQRASLQPGLGLVTSKANKPTMMQRATPATTRSLSTTARKSSSATAESEPRTASSSTAGGQKQLDWNTFFQLRLRRRRYQLFFSAMGSLGCFVGGSAMLASGAADPVVSMVSLDPFLTMGVMAISFGALGWLAGPTLGGWLFYLRNGRWRKQITAKEVEFFARVKRNRVDPSASSAANPVPDFYGEKIQSVAGYRQWLKDQRAFNKKRSRFVV